MRARRLTGLRRLAATAAIAALAAACSPQVSVHGYVPTEDDLASIEPGIDTVATVADRVGRPSSSGLLRESDWYYVQTTISQLTYNPPEVTDRMVVAIAFDEEGVVQSVDRYGLEDGRIVNLNPRVTPTGGQRRNILIQIFSGLLNVNAESLLN